MDACTVEIWDKNYAACYLNLFCLSNMKNLGRNFPCLVSAHGQISSFLCSKFQLIYHGRLPGPSEGNYKEKKPNKNEQKPQTSNNKTKIMNSLHFEKRLVPDWKIPMRWSFYFAKIEHLPILLSTCQFGKTTSLSHISHVKRFQTRTLKNHMWVLLQTSHMMENWIHSIKTL